MKKLIFISIFLPIYTLYLLTIPPTVYWQDSGIFLAGLKVFGILYPPGFPLYVLLGVLWTHLATYLLSLTTYHLTFAQQVHAFSGLWGAGASALIGLSVHQLLTSLQSNNQQITNKLSTNNLISVFSGLITGLSYSLWSQSINAEIYSMAGFFSALLFYFVIKIILSFPKNHSADNTDTEWQKRYQKLLFALALIWGLSFSAHLSTLVLFLPLLWLSFQFRFFPLIRIRKGQEYHPLLSPKNWLLILFVFSTSAILPYLYLPLRSTPDNQMLWSKIDSPSAFVEHITGRAYMTSDNAIRMADLDKAQSYPTLFFQEFFVLGIIVGLLGIWFLWKKRAVYRSLPVFFLLYALTLYLLISFYERGTEYNYWLIPLYLFWPIFIGIGLWTIAGRVKKLSFRFPIILILSLGIVFPQLWINWPFLNRSHYYLAEEFGKNLLGKLPGNAIFFTLGDQESSIPLYLNLVLGYRRDLAVIAASDLIFDYKRQFLAKKRPDIYLPPVDDEDLVNSFISANLDKKIFVITKNYFPLANQFKLVPAGTIWEIVKADDAGEIDLSRWDYAFSDPNRYQRPERPELERKKTSYVNGVPVVTHQRTPYFDEAKTFEIQAKKNLGDWCFAAYEGKRTIPVKTEDGKHEQWGGEKLASCALEAYEEMFEIDPDFQNQDIFSKLDKLKNL